MCESRKNTSPFPFGSNIVHQGLMSTLNAVPLHRFSRLTCLYMVLTFTRGGRGKSTPMAPMIAPIDLACPGTGASCAFSPPLAERRLCCQQLQQHAAVDICQQHDAVDTFRRVSSLAELRRCLWSSLRQHQ